MNEAATENIKIKMIQALNLMKEALDASIPFFKTAQKNNIIMLWEAFIKEFLAYLKQKSKETGINLLSSISISRLWFK